MNVLPSSKTMQVNPVVQWQSIYLTYIVFEEESTFIPHLFLTIIYIEHKQLTCNDELDINNAVGCWLQLSQYLHPLISLYSNLVQWQSIYLTYIVFEEGSTFIPQLFLTIIYIKHEQLTCNDELDINDAVGCWLQLSQYQHPLISLYTNLVQWQSIYLTYIVFEEGSTFIPHLFLTIVYIEHKQLTCNDELEIKYDVGCSSVNTSTH